MGQGNSTRGKKTHPASTPSVLTDRQQQLLEPKDIPVGKAKGKKRLGPNYSSLSCLPIELLDDIVAGYLNSKDSLAVSSTCRFLRSTQRLNLNNNPVTKPLLHVALGQQDAAENYFKQDIELLFKKGKVTDYSHRTFNRISPLQYAFWAYDRHMWDMMMECIGDDDALKLRVLEELEALEDKETEHGAHYDFNELITALQGYVNLVSADKVDWKKADKHWREQVGGAQRKVPVHVANEYCLEGRNFAQVPGFKESDFTRRLGFYDGTSVFNSNKLWFPAGPGLASDFGIGRAAGRARRWRGPCSLLSEGSGPRAAQCDMDLAAITALCKVRTEELGKLKTDLRALRQSKLPPPPEPVPSAPQPGF